MCDFVSPASWRWIVLAIHPKVANQHAWKELFICVVFTEYLIKKEVSNAAIDAYWKYLGFFDGNKHHILKYFLWEI